MIDCNALATQLRSLAVFRGILDNKVMCALLHLLEEAAQPQTAANAVDAWGAFAAALYAHTECFSDYLLKAVLDDENLYVQRKSVQEPLCDSIEDCLRAELCFLQRLSQLDSNTLREAIVYDNFLPAWTTKPLKFQQQYARRIEQLPRVGYGIYAKYHAFTIHDSVIVPVKHPDPQSIDMLSGYERERGMVLANTYALLKGLPASNVLLYGDAGTGKSSTVKAIANALKGEGLRLIEVKKNQLYQIPDLVETLSRNPLKFILFIDDLSFSTNDDDFAALKAILEGSVNGRGSNLAVYATSNRRHLIKENFSERDGDDLHLADTMQELMSLSARFGLTITFSRPDKDLYLQIVQNLARLYEIDMPTETLIQRAEAQALRNGGRSPRVAKQLIEQIKATT